MTYIHFTGIAANPRIQLRYTHQPRHSTMIQYVTAPDPIPSGVSYITPGKRYKMEEMGKNLFSIVNNDGDTIICVKRNCSHLEGDWIIRTHWRYNNSHNGINGTVRCIITYMKRVTQAPSLTPRGRTLSVDIERLLERLDKETWTFRRELDGNTTIMKHKNKRKFIP